MRRRIRGWPRRMAVAGVMLAIVAAAGGCTGVDRQPASAAPPPRTAGNPSSQASGSFGQIPDVVSKTQTSVVTIITSKGLGSGVVWSADGIVATNEHVINGSKRVEVAFADGRRVGGTVRTSDAITDLAVVQADRKGLPPATFQKQLPRVGDLAIAIGSPLGFENTVTAGIISGLHREIPGSAQQTQSLVDLIQTDAAISPGNSGGAVVNANGQVVGISEAFIPPSEGAVSIGFAIPAETAVNVVSQLLQSGRARHAFLGVQPGDLTPEIAQQLGVSASSGMVVLDVVNGGPAAKAGLRPGDVITAINGKQISNVEDFLAALRPLSPGDTVTVDYLRGKAKQQAKVVLADRPTANG
jgi:serine protease DegQ